MDKETKPAVKTEHAPLPPAPVPARKPGTVVSRETTVGMIVAGVFIALVAGVVVTKTMFNPKNQADPSPEQAMASGMNPPAPFEPKLPPPANTRPSGWETQAPVAAPATPSSPVTPFQPVAPPAPASTIETPLVVETTPAAPPKNASGIQQAGAESLVIPDSGPKPARSGPIEIQLDPTAIVVPADVPLPQDNKPKTAPTADKDIFTAKGKNDSMTISPPAPPSGGDPVAPNPKDPILLVEAADSKKNSPPPVDAPPVLTVPDMPAPVKKNDPFVAEPPPKIDLPSDPASKKNDAPAPIEAPKVELPTITIPKKDNAETPVITMPKKESANTTMSAPMVESPLDKPEKKDSATKLESPFEAAPKTDNPPAVLDLSPMKKNAPAAPPTAANTEMKKDGEYDEDLHSLKQNESYRSISKQYYNSEAYALALQRYNSEYPAQADYVRIPPIWLLEKRYPSDVTASQARPVNFTQSPVAAVTPRNDPVYTVSDNGEMLAEIARRQLGSEESWKRIWDLNPQLNPAKTVPGGTRLRMPLP